MVIIPMMEEFDKELQKVSRLVQEMEEHNTRFPEHCNDLMKTLEEKARRYSLYICPQLSLLRGKLLAAGGGQKGDRKEKRRVRDEQLLDCISQACDCVRGFFAPYRAAWEECASLCSQTAARAASRGILPPGYERQAEAGWAAIAADAETSPVLAHVVGRAGTVNARILMDRALSAAVINKKECEINGN